MTEKYRVSRLSHAFGRVLPVVALSVGMLSGQAFAQTSQTTPQPSNVVSLSAMGEADVPQDLLTLSLRTTKEGSTAASVQGELKADMDRALSLARAHEKKGLMDVRTGQFSLYPRYGKEGKIAGWQGTAELVLEGTDFALVSGTAGKLDSLTMSSAAFSLSRPARQRLEKEVEAIAIDRFRSRASDVAKGFGFASYELREVSVSPVDEGGMPVNPRMMAMEAKSMSDASIPVAAGSSTVRVTVVGSIQLR
ncbi:SIMPL domain-containing protein [Hydrogenophaga sp.]|uniref:SIMPL domain-containing protein n=1 Tax=Hydrogenophaga sp. TaxID=1904254 RepID=UPI00271D47D7|nr:SIMPL domain-containing protein [Hydrogenophaga sp.]MDO8905832.1 SIMPL domain-containing protein [Hydrogenophaga sp.]